MRDDGTLLGMRVHMSMDQGAYPAFPFSAAMYPLMIRTMIPGPYRLPALGFSTTLTASNKATYVAYRGPWAVETWVRERLLDIAARELGIGRDEIRLRNMIGADELPRRMLTGPTLDVLMSARTTLDGSASQPAEQTAGATGEVANLSVGVPSGSAPIPTTQLSDAAESR